MQDYCVAHRKTIGAVIVFSVSRFSRMHSDHVFVKVLLKKLGIQLFSATEPIDDTPEGQMMETIFSAYAQYDNQAKARRTKEGMRAGARSGKWMHKPPLGYLTASGTRGVIEIDATRSSLIRKAFELFDGGKYTKREILRVVTRLGLTTLAGKPLSAQALDNMLRNPLYAGMIEESSLGVTAPGNFEPTINRDLFERVQNRHAGVGAPQERNSSDAEFPLRVFVRCHKCGHGLTGSFSTGSKGNRYPYYFCRVQACRDVSFSRNNLHMLFLNVLSSHRMEEGSKKLFRAVISDVWERKNFEKKDTLSQSRTKIAELEHTRQAIFNLFVAERIGDEEYRKQTDRIEGMLAEVKTLEAESLIGQAELDRLLDFAEWMTWSAELIWSRAPIADRLRIQNAFFPEGVVAFKETLGTPPTTSFIKEFIPPIVELRNHMSSAFPVSLEQLEGEVRTPPTNSFVKEISSQDEEFSTMASPEGVEPSLPP